MNGGGAIPPVAAVGMGNIPPITHVGKVMETTHDVGQNLVATQIRGAAEQISQTANAAPPPGTGNLGGILDLKL